MPKEKKKRKRNQKKKKIYQSSTLSTSECGSLSQINGWSWEKWLVSLTAPLPGPLYYLWGPSSLYHPSSQEARISPSPQTGLWPDLPAGAKLVFHSKIMKVVEGGRAGRNKHFKQSSLQKNISGCLTLNLIVLSLKKKNNCLTWGGGASWHKAFVIQMSSTML